jgi:hypothetical protein
MEGGGRWASKAPMQARETRPREADCTRLYAPDDGQAHAQDNARTDRQNYKGQQPPNVGQSGAGGAERRRRSGASQACLTPARPRQATPASAEEVIPSPASHTCHMASPFPRPFPLALRICPPCLSSCNVYSPRKEEANKPGQPRLDRHSKEAAQAAEGAQAGRAGHPDALTAPPRTHSRLRSRSRSHAHAQACSCSCSSLLLALAHGKRTLTR